MKVNANRLQKMTREVLAWTGCKDAACGMLGVTLKTLNAWLDGNVQSVRSRNFLVLEHSYKKVVQEKGRTMGLAFYYMDLFLKHKPESVQSESRDIIRNRIKAAGYCWRNRSGHHSLTLWDAEHDRYAFAINLVSVMWPQLSMSQRQRLLNYIKSSMASATN